MGKIIKLEPKDSATISLFVYDTKIVLMKPFTKDQIVHEQLVQKWKEENTDRSAIYKKILERK